MKTRISSVQAGKYTDGLSINLHTGGVIEDHALIKFYQIFGSQ